MQTLNQNKLIETKKLLANQWGAFVKTFVTELKANIDKLLSETDNNKIAFIAHKQKSSCAIVGAEILADNLQKIEILSKEKSSSIKLIKNLPLQLQELLNEENLNY